MNPTPTKHAIFAGGCFWCTEAQFAGVPGVVSVMPGYTGGQVANPTYEQVCSKKTGHHEAVRIEYDPAVTDYTQLLDVFWSGIDPTDEGGQFYDRGGPYLTAVFYSDEAQRAAAEASRARVAAELGKQVHTQILPEAPFYPAEDYHRRYFETNAAHYNAYKKGSGREKKLQQLWKSKD